MDKYFEEKVSEFRYRELVGSLLYLVVCTRPYTENSVSKLERFVSKPMKRQWELLKNVLIYVK